MKPAGVSDANARSVEIRTRLLREGAARRSVTRTPISFSDLRTAAYCPRKCYYQRLLPGRGPRAAARSRGDSSSPPRYDELLEAPPGPSSPNRSPSRPFATASGWRRPGSTRGTGSMGAPPCPCRSGGVRDRPALSGHRPQGARGPARAGADLVGEPPETGVWTSQSVHAVAAAKALAWEHQVSVERAWLEYPAYGVIRSIDLTTRRKAQYPERVAGGSRVRRSARADEQPLEM